MLLSSEVIGTVRGLIKRKYGQKCTDDEVSKVIQDIISEEIDPTAIKIYKKAKPERLKRPSKTETKILAAKDEIEKVDEVLPASEN